MSENNENDKKNKTLVVGFGASAGGLEPLKIFFDSLPDKTGMAFIVIMHLSPDHGSKLSEILQPHTSLKVLQVDRKTEIKPEHIYVIPPNKRLIVGDNHLELKQLKSKDHRPQVVDQFFRSLGKVKGSDAACIILSGTGSDGSIGMKAVKEHGGLIIAQDPDEAQYPGMPQSAIDTGLVEMVLPVGEMAGELMAYKNDLSGTSISDNPDALSEDQEEVLSEIITHLRVKTDHDFSHYKRTTVLRRIDRRMHVHRDKSLGAYLSTLKKNEEEAGELFKDLLISVTNFFRDPEAFQALESKVIPKLFEGKERDDQLRVWVPGCATGQEAYSLAILLHEYAGSIDNPPECQIFATDIDEEALQTARHGKYSESIASDIGSDRLERFFVKDGSEYQIKEELRDIILFTKHDMLGNPPFSDLDLISCRNLLIYLNRKLQGEVFNLFHYALHLQGYLFLGKSDSNLEATELFSTFDKQHSIYRQSSKSKSKVHLPNFPLRFKKNKLSASHTYRKRSQTKTNFDELHRTLISRRHGLSSVIINENYEVLHATGGIDQYLKYSSGEPSRNILEMVIPELRHPLRSIFFQAKKDEHNFPLRKSTRMDGEAGSQLIELTVHKINEDDFPDDLLFVVFKKIEKDKSNIHKKIAVNEAISDGEVEIIEELESELENAREQLQTTVEDYETSNEELRSSNEELQSMNEELQSTTEELETSQEELYSVNEELKTVNQELQVKIEELSESNNDLKNLMDATEVGILFVDRDFCIQRFTAAAADIFNLIPADLGRPLAHLTHQLAYETLLEDVKHVIKSDERTKKIVSSRNGRWYIMRIRDYRTTGDKSEGVVISFVEITELKKSQQKLEKKARQEEALAQLGLYALTGKGPDEVVHRAMQMICDIFKADYILLLEVNHERNTLHLKDAIGLENENPAEEEIDIDEKSDAGFAFANMKPVIVDDYREEDHFNLNTLFDNSKVTSGINVVVQSTGEAYGVLEMYTVEKRVFSEHDMSFLQVVANLVGETMERKKTEGELETTNKQLEKELKRSEKFQREILNNSLSERWKLGEFLHDNLAQKLIAAKIMTAHIENKLADKELNLSTEFNEIEDVLEKSISGLRDLTHDIIPLDIEKGGILHAFKFLMKRTEKMYKVNCILDTDDIIDQFRNKEMITNLYLIVQEVVKNAAIHGKAKNIKVNVSSKNGELLLEIEDDGSGFPDTPKEGSGRGLNIMNHRMESMGGTCIIENSKDSAEGGACVKCTVALDELTKTE